MKSHDNVTPLRPKKQLDIPPEHIPLLFNSLLCERLCNFTRTLDPATNDWKWEGATSDGSTPSAELFDFVHNPPIALELLERVCTAQNWGYGLSFDPPNGGPISRNVVIVVQEPGGMRELAKVGQAHLIGFGIALALTVAFQMDVPAQHRELFPGHYLHS